MNELDYKLKKDLLKPLVRRGRGRFNRKALQKALAKLEERALGEHLLDQVRSYLEA